MSMGTWGGPLNDFENPYGKQHRKFKNPNRKVKMLLFKCQMFRISSDEAGHPGIATPVKEEDLESVEEMSKSEPIEEPRVDSKSEEQAQSKENDSEDSEVQF